MVGVTGSNNLSYSAIAFMLSSCFYPMHLLRMACFTCETSFVSKPRILDSQKVLHTHGFFSSVENITALLLATFQFV